MVCIFTAVATVAAIGPTTLVLAVVVVAALLVYSQTRAVPRVNPYGSNVHVRGREPRVFDGGCSVSIDAFPYNGPGTSNGARPAGRDRVLHAFACRMTTSWRKQGRKTLTFLV